MIRLLKIQDVFIDDLVMPFNIAIILYLAHFLKVEICDFPKYHEYQLGYLETMKFSLWGLLNLAFSDLFIRRHF